MRRSLSVLFALFTPAAAEAAGVLLALHGHGLPPATRVTVTIAPAEKAGPEGPSAVTRETAIAVSELPLDLPSGFWSIDAAGDGVWHARQYLRVPSVSNGPIVIDLWPAVTVTGKVTVERGELPVELRARFAPSEEGSGLPEGEVTCPVADAAHQGAFACSLPAGTLDLRLRPPRFVARYLWTSKLEAGKVFDTGAMLFRRGSSIVGRVEVRRGVAVQLAKVRVETSPVTSFAPEPDRRSAKLLPRGTGLEKGSFFHLDGIAPGAYQLVARQGRLVSPALVLNVGEGMEINLSKPLVIDEPHTLTVRVSPPLAPSGLRWHINVVRDAGRAGLDYIDGGNASKEEGLWQSVGLHPGQYLVELLDGHDRWGSEQVSLSGEPLTLPMMATSGMVHGTVLLGDTPLAAEVTLAVGGERSVMLHSDEQGKFQGRLPEAPPEAQWEVRVKADAPMLKRRFRSVTLAKGEDGAYELSLNIPRSVLSGRVLDERGKGQVPGRVDIRSLKGDDGILQPNLEADGTFAVHGLPPGRYFLQGSSPDGESDRVEATIDEDGTSEPVSLVIHPVQIVRGHVRSEFGPIAGAKVLVVPVDRQQMINAHAPTEADGEFWASVPSGTRLVDISVAAPGFGYKLLRAQVSKEPLAIVMDTMGGSLIVTGLEGKEIPYLLHGGAMQAAVVSVFECDGEEVWGRSWRLRIPLAESGSYAVCFLGGEEKAPQPGRCVAGYLPPLGSITIDTTAIQAQSMAAVR
jgi:hypothetical protein